MSQSLSTISIHVVFSTKNRKPYLNSEDIRNCLYEYIKKVCLNYHCYPHAIGGTADHIHLLVSLNKNITVSKFLEKIKKNSSKWIKCIDRDYSLLKEFYWQSGYGAFSVSKSNIPAIIKYIETQEQHHKKIHFKDELKQLLTLHGISFDEKYLWN